MVAACGIWCFGFQVVGMVWSWGLCVRFAGCLVWGMLLEQRPSHRTHSLRRHTADPQHTTTLDNSPHCCNHSLTLLNMGKRLPETCWADWKINKFVTVASSWYFILFNYIYDARSTANQIYLSLL
jgi:hypothetical protein